MNRKKFRKNPARRKTWTEEMSDYRRSLGQKPVTDTEEGVSAFDDEGTDYVPPPSTPPAKETAPSPKLHNTYLFIGIALGVLTIIAVLGGAVYKFAALSTGLNSLEKNVSDNKRELQERINKSEEELRKDIRQMADRIDKYFSKDQKR